MLLSSKAWLVILVFQFGTPASYIVEFPAYEQCAEAIDSTVDDIYGDRGVALVEATCFYKD